MSAERLHVHRIRVYCRHLDGECPTRSKKAAEVRSCVGPFGLRILDLSRVPTSGICNVREGRSKIDVQRERVCNK